MNVFNSQLEYPPPIRFGNGRISEIADTCKAAGVSKLLLVTDRANRHQLKQLDQKIANQLNTYSKRARAYCILQSIPGLGATTAVTILIECPEIGMLSNKAVASLAGLAPYDPSIRQMAWKRLSFRGEEGPTRCTLHAYSRSKPLQSRLQRKISSY